MTTTFKNALLALVLILGLAVEVEAQDRYEYASIGYQLTFTMKTYTLHTSISGTYSSIDGKISEGNVSQNCTPIILQAEEMSKDGWEVYSTSYSTNGILYYYLKRTAK